MLTSPNAKVDKTEKYYQTPFSSEVIEGPKIKEWQRILAKGDDNPRLALPDKNSFIPANIVIKDADGKKRYIPFAETPKTNP